MIRFGGNNGIELSDKKLKLLLHLIVSLFIVFLAIRFYLFDNKSSFRERLIESLKNEVYEGVVVKKYYDKENHNTPMIVFSNNQEAPIYGQFYSQIQNNDSVVKKKGDTRIFVYRGKQTIIFDNLKVIE